MHECKAVWDLDQDASRGGDLGSALVLHLGRQHEFLSRGEHPIGRPLGRFDEGQQAQCGWRFDVGEAGVVHCGTREHREAGVAVASGEHVRGEDLRQPRFRVPAAGDHRQVEFASQARSQFGQHWGAADCRVAALRLHLHAYAVQEGAAGVLHHHAQDEFLPGIDTEVVVSVLAPPGDALGGEHPEPRLRVHLDDRVGVHPGFRGGGFVGVRGGSLRHDLDVATGAARTRDAVAQRPVRPAARATAHPPASESGGTTK